MSSRTEIILLALIILLGGVLRLGWPGLTEFKGDEARLMLLSLEMAQGEQFPVRGIGSSVGVPNAPMSVWLYALPLVFWKHLYAATLFTGLLNTAALLGCWWLVRRYWGAEAALAAALLMAVSPWAIFHSRKIWAQNLLPFFTLGWGISGLLTFVEGKPRWLIVHLLCLAIAAQAHFAGMALGPATGLFLLLFRGRVNLKWLTAGIAAAALTALPFLIHLSQAGISLSRFLRPTGESSRGLDLMAGRYGWWLITGHDLYTLVGGEALADYRAIVPSMGVISAIITLCFVAGVGLWLKQGWANGPLADGQPARPPLLFMLIWLLAPVLFFSLPFLPVVHHYLLPFYPLPFAAAGVALADLGRRTRGWGWLLLLVIAGGQLWGWVGLQQVMVARDTPGGLGTPVAYYVDAAAQVRTWWPDEGEAELLLGGEGESSEFDEFAAIFAVLLAEYPHRFINSQAHALFPAQPALVLLSPTAAVPVRQVYQDAAASFTTLPLRPGEGEILLVQLAAAPTPSQPLTPPALAANWVQIEGYTPLTSQDEQTAVWAIHWQTGDYPDPADYHFFNHLLAADGMRVAQQDGPLFAPTQWRAGDRVISYFTLPWSLTWPRPLMMNVGIYRYPEVENIPFLDVAGNPYAVWLTLPAEK